MATKPTRHKRSSVPGKKPTISQLVSGELALNTADGKVFLLKDDNTVADITQSIFQNNSSITVTDENDSSQGIISVVVDGSEKINITNAAISLNENVVIENENSLTFRENVGGGLSGVSIKAPTNLDSSYSMTLPSEIGLAGSILAINSTGDLYFSSPDVFGGKSIFVSSENGDDANDGVNLPVKTLKRACQIASGLVYNPNGTPNGSRYNIQVAAGDYVENNPVIIPDNVIVKGDGLRGCIIRPLNANQDMLRVRNGSYFAEFTFRDNVDTNFVPLFTFDYAVAFDDPDDATVSRVGYTYLPDTRPTIVTSPYIQNCSIISFLGGNGAKIDGSKVNSPNVSLIPIESENPVAGPAPEQGKSMVANAFTMLSFGGTGWRLTNDAYAQIVSCFQIFLLNGVYTQSGGYCSVTNSATNFGLYALRSSGYSPKTFTFDRSFVAETGVSSGSQTLTVVGVNRAAPVEEFVIRFRDPEYKIAYDLMQSEKANIAQDTIDWIANQIATATPSSIWYNYVYNSSKCYRDLLIILDSIAQDTWSTGNILTRQAALAYYTSRMADSSNNVIAGEVDQTVAAIEQASVYTATVLASLDVSVRTFVDLKFDLIKDAISDPDTIPDVFTVTSAGDISNDYKTSATEVTFNAATGINATLDIVTIAGHGFTNGQAVVYNSNGNPAIPGLDNEQTYYIKLININEFSLTYDDSLTYNVNIRSAGTGTHKFMSGTKEFYINDILSSHTTYQTLILESGSESLEFVPGRAITGTTGVNNNSAYVYSWKPFDRELVVSIEEVVVGQATQRVQFDATSVIDSDHALVPSTNIGINETAAKTGLSTATFTVGSTVDGGTLTNLVNLLEKQAWFHRPSIVNSSSHTWEYAGSGTDYNALPQNGGNTIEKYEQYQELPGRVYTSGTNELGDFKVGNFITAYNRTGNITFRNKVQVEELDALRLTLSDVAIEELSTNVNLGDDEIGGPSNNRLSTQLAIRSFLSNRLGGFIDKTVSTAAVPGAIVQLNTNGQLNADLIPATRQFTSTTTEGYLSKLLQVDDIPAVDLKAGDIATEEYEQIELTLSGNITAADGDTITQPSTGAIGYAKGSFSNSPTIIVASIGAEFKAGDDSTGTDFDTAGTLYVNAVSAGVNPTSLGTSSAITENFFLKRSISSQYLVLSNDSNYVFTSAAISNVSRNGSNVATITTSTNHNLQTGGHVQVICTSDETFTVNGEILSTPALNTFTISNEGALTSPTAATGSVRTIVSSADGNAQGAVTETRYGVLTNVDNANIVGGSNYTPASGSLVYENVPINTITGVGTGAYADVTVTAGQVTDVDLRRGGTGYAVGDLVGVEAQHLGDDSAGTGFYIEVTAIEKRAYINVIGGELFVASTSSVDFVEDNTAPSTAIVVTLTDTISKNFLAGDVGSGGAVNYTTNRITISSHGYTNGDPVTYNTLGNVAIGGLLNNDVYYVKSIDSSTIELYEDFSLLNQIEFTSTPANNNHNVTRYVVNIIDNSVIVPAHGLATGDAVRFEGVDLFDIAGTQVVSGSRFFIGSVTTNSFTLHELRSDALVSINGLVTGAKNIDAVGTGTATVYQQNVQVNSVVNTSSRIKENWNSLTASNIDADNIVSGTISPSRLASSGSANTDTFLRGDSSYQTVVQSIKKSTSTDNPIVLSGSNIAGEYYGDPVSIGISNVDFDAGNPYSTLGVSRFLQSQFDVDAGGSGQVFIKNGVVDAGTLDSLDSAYFLNPSNFTSAVPVNKGGTNLTTYAAGDVLYAQTSSTISTLPIGRANAFMRSTGSAPEWSTALELAEGLDVKSARLSSTSVGIGTVYNENVTSLELGSNAETVKIGRSTATRTLTTFVSGYAATISTTVAVNLASFNLSTNATTNPSVNEVPMASTTGILYGMLVTGSASIPSDTTVTGVTDSYVYLSNDTTGTISSGTALTFTYTPLTLGIRAGDTINIATSGITNLDGQWPVLAATANGNSFTISTAAVVTANPVNPVAGSITKDNTIVIRNRNVIFGSAEASSSPVAATLKGESAIGTDTSGGSFVIQAGLGTGTSTGGTIVFKTGQTTTTGAVEQVSTTRLTIATSGQATFTGTIVTAGTIQSSATTANVFNTVSTTVNAFGAATALTMGATTGTTTIRNSLTVTGDLVVNGTTTTVNSTVISVDDKNIELGAITTPTNVSADGGGITLRGDTDKTIIWDTANTNWSSSENWNLLTGKVFKINNTQVLSATALGSGVTASSLTSVGTIGTGTWQGSVIAGTYGGTGVNNGTKTITLGSNFSTVGASAIVLTSTGVTDVTLPTSGTLAVIGNPLSQFAATTSLQLAGVISDETGSGKLVFATSPTFTTSLLTDSTTLAVFNTTATTVNAFGAASTLTMGAATSMVTFGDDVTVTGVTKATQGVQFGATDSLLYESASNVATLRIGADGPYVSFTDSGSNVATISGTAGVVLSATAATLGLVATGANVITATTNGTERLRVGSDGNVGIGTSSPGNRLHINQTVSSQKTDIVKLQGTYAAGDLSHGIGFSINANAVSAGVYATEAGGAGAALIFTTSPDYALPTNAERMRILANGNVGIGKTNPSTALDVNGTVTATAFAGPLTGAVTGNASTATTLQTARTIGDVSFNGSANIVPERIVYKDTRSTDFVPYTYDGVTLHLKTNTTDGLADGGTYHGVLDLAHWSDASGGVNHQLGLTDNGHIYIRYSTGASTWASWTKIYDTGDAATANTASTLVLRDSSGNFSAGTVTAALSGNATTATTLQTARNINSVSFNGSADITITANTTNALTFNSGGAGAVSGTTFNGSAAQTISYNTLGASPLAGSTSLTTTGTVTTGTWSASFGAVSGANLTSLTAGNLTGTIPSTVLGNSSVFIGTTSVALNRATANLGLTGITSIAMPGATSGTITVTPAATAGTTAITIPATTGTLITSGDNGTVTSTMIADGTIVNGDINANAAIADTKLATISTAGKVSNSATTATNANTVSAIVARDGSGNFSAGTITAALSGNATTATTLQTSRNINGVAFNGSADITIPSLFDTNYRRITNPGGAEFVTTTNVVTGAIQITLPDGYTSTMMRMTVKVFDYASNESFDVHISGYNYSVTPSWINTSAHIVGNPSVDRRFTVRFGHTAAGKNCIYIGELASTWNYPQVFVTDLQLGFSNQTVLYTTGWSISFQTVAFENVTATITNPQVGYAVSTNTANSVVLRDASGNFSAGTITASLNGNASTATNATTVTNGVYTTGAQSIAGAKTFTGDIISTMPWDATDGGGQIYLNGTTGNRIDWSTAGVSAPTFTTRSAGTKLVLYPGVGASSADYAVGIESGGIWFGVPTTAGSQFRWYGGTTVAATLTSGGSFTATGEVTAYSDIRIKDNVAVIADPLTKVLGIRGVTFTRTDLEDTNRVYMGVIAQEVEQYIPEVVTTSEDGTKSVNYGAMAGLFIEAIKEQQKQIDELKELVKKLAER